MWLEPFQNYLKYERNYSEHTLLAYTRDLQDFEEFLQSFYDLSPFNENDLTSIHHKMIRNWMGELLNRGLTRKTVARKLASLSSFFKFLQKSGVMKKNPASRVKAPKVEKTLPVYAKEHHMENLFEKVDFPDDFEGARDRAILEVLYGCGLRRSELLGLNFGDINFGKQTLQVLGKGNKERIVPFGTHVHKALQIYMQACDNEGLNYKAPFFVKKDGKALYPKLILRMVDKYLSLASSLQKRSPHILRHTFATHLLNNGADLNAIKELLGHASLAATQVYVHNSIAKLKNIHNNAHPKA